jgi:hypothetical protein
MSLLLQELLVGLVVAACAACAAWRLMSGRARLACLRLLGTLPGARSSRWHAALSRRTLARLSGCAGCAPLSPGARAPNQTPGAPRR